jgi:hypothetical protein
MKHYCKCCESEIITKRMEFPICPICLNATILLHQPALVDMKRLEAEAKHLMKVPAWETPVQYEKRTGKPYPNEGPVWELFEYLPYLPVCEWMLKEYRYANIGRRLVVCAYGSPERPPDDWKPGGGGG